ncbi:MAG TPA: phosphoribosylaminoimidazolesuccinocarboxamide synthase [Candidatus Binatia bacterium]|jgi:phosphoribosylaminoimidazole-succinocarboxamide synthase|nr:phosphoribosylaminoimidazolesuccinocarboxamide synthase [Candidatus Binatia bacterium]
MAEQTLSGLKLFNRGKVRDIYDLGDKLLLVASDRISAFDVILPTLIPDKGKILTRLSEFWFGIMKDIVPHHLITTRVEEFPAACHPHKAELEGRSMLVKKSTPAPVECIVRGYLVGSGWKDYQQTGAVCGVALPQGLVEASRLDQPIFTPSTKAPVGAHDVNITFEEMAVKIGRKRAERMRDVTIAIYSRARDLADKKGILIADTKLEFGIEGDDIMLIDEVLTPDSSRFWPADGYRPGKTPDSFDKQFVRDYLLNLPWDMKSPPPALPREIVKKTQEKYAEALRRLTS